MKQHVLRNLTLRRWYYRVFDAVLLCVFIERKPITRDELLINYRIAHLQAEARKLEAMVAHYGFAARNAADLICRYIDGLEPR